MFNLQNKVVVIIGGGKIAYRKASGLKDTGAFVTVNSPEICEKNFLILLGSKNF